MLLKLMAHHHVSPCYLKLITSFCYDSTASDPNIGSFYSKTYFKSFGPKVARLGRSGRHFQMAFQLTSYYKDSDRVDNETRFTWAKYRAAVYHHFDIEEARSLWIITTPRRSEPRSEERELWRGIDESANKSFATASTHEAWLKANLGVFLALADWSWSRWCVYVYHIGNEATEIVSPASRSLLAVYLTWHRRASTSRRGINL